MTRWMQLVAMMLVLGMANVGSAVEKMPPLPVPGKVTLVEIGSKTCAPCLAMLPILEQLRADYHSQVAVILVDLWDYPNAAYTLGIKQIPAFLFYNRQGNEVRRHEGVLEKEDIVAELDRLTAEKEEEFPVCLSPLMYLQPSAGAGMPGN